MQGAVSQSTVWGTDVSDDLKLDARKLELALAKQRAAQAAAVETDDRKRKYNSLASSDEITPEEMEAYRMTRLHAEDPMAKMLSEGVTHA
jgi:pre-mRNA-processing factor SLU7